MVKVKVGESYVDIIYFYLKQRRVWVAILSILSFIATYLGYFDVSQLISIMAAQAGLALWSFNAPKK